MALGQKAKQDVLTSSGSSEVRSVPTPTPVIENTVDTAKSSFSGGPPPQESKKEPEPEAAADDFLNAESEKKGGSILEDVCLPLVTKEASKDEEERNKKRKTTAADLVKDLETQPEDDHDVIASGCNLDVLPGDVGELELDDDELLGNGHLSVTWPRRVLFLFLK